METKPKLPIKEQKFLSNLQEERGYLEAFLYLFTKTDIFTNLCQAYGKASTIVPKGADKYKHAESLFDLIRKVVALKKNFDSREIYTYLKFEDHEEDPIDKFLASISIAFRIEHFLNKISPNFAGVEISNIDHRVKEVVKEVGELTRLPDPIKEYDEYILDCFYKAVKNERKIPPNLTVIQKQDIVIETLKTSRAIAEKPDKFARLLLKELKPALYKEEFLNLSLLSSDPVASIISHALCSLLNDDFNLDKLNPNDPRETLQTLLQEHVSNESYRRLNFCQEFDYQLAEGQHRHSFEMQRYYLKNTIYFNQVSLNPKCSRSVEKQLVLTLSVYKGNPSIWGYGNDHLHFATDALKNITFKSSDQNSDAAQIESLQNAVCRIKFEDVYKHVYQAISDNCLDLTDLPKCAFYLFEDGFFYMVDRMSSTLREIRPGKTCHLLVLSSNYVLNRAKSPEGMIVMIVAGKVDPSDSLWVPYLGSQDTTVFDIIEHILKHVVGNHKRKMRAQTGIRKVLSDVEFTPADILDSVRFSISKDSSVKSLDENWETLKQRLDIANLSKAPMITLKQILDVLVHKDPKRSARLREPTPNQHTRVTLICTFNALFCNKKDKEDTFRNFLLGAEQVLVYERGNSSSVINKQGYTKPKEVEEPNESLVARVQPVKEIKLFPKPCDFLQAMVRYDANSRLFAGDNSSHGLPPGYWPIKNEPVAPLVVGGAQSIAISQNIGASQHVRPGIVAEARKTLLPAIFLPNLYFMDVSGLDCIDPFSTFELGDLSYLEEEDGIFVSVRYRPIGMIFKNERTLETDRKKIKTYFNVLEICTDTLESLQSQDVNIFGDLFVRECIRSKIYVPEPPKLDPKTNQPLPDQPEVKITPEEIKLDEIQKSRLVTYYKYHGSTFDMKTGNLERKPMQYLLFSEINFGAEGPVKTVLLERLPVR